MQTAQPIPEIHPSPMGSSALTGSGSRRRRLVGDSGGDAHWQIPPNETERRWAYDGAFLLSALRASPTSQPGLSPLWQSNLGHGPAKGRIIAAVSSAKKIRARFGIRVMIGLRPALLGSAGWDGLMPTHS
jgi:hypothetical protein